MFCQTLSLMLLVFSLAKYAEGGCYADVYFVLDNSQAMDLANYNKELSFVNSLIAMHPIGPNGMRYGVIQTSTEGHLLFSLKEFADQQALSKKLMSAKPVSPAEKYFWMGMALVLINDKNLFSPAWGGRPDAQDIIVMISDGYAPVHQPTISWSNYMKNKGYIIITLAIGNPPSLMRQMASSQKDVFNVSSYNALSTVKTRMMERICSYPKEAEKCDNNEGDVIFVIDSSGSLGPVGYKKELEFVTELLTSLDIGPDTVRVGAIIYSQEVHKRFDLNTYNDRTAISNAITSSLYLNSTTATDKALNFIVDSGMLETRSGGRPIANNVVVVLTDGRSNNPNETLKAAERVKLSDKTSVLSVGFGDANEDELKGIASKDEYVFQALNVNELWNIKRRIADIICKASKYRPGECEEFYAN